MEQEAKNFFYNIGVDIKKPTEIWLNTINADGSAWYGGWYHVCGKILVGERAHVEIAPNTFNIDESKVFKVTEKLHIHFNEKCDLLSDSFPRPVIQLEIYRADIPWVMEEKYS